MLTRQTPRDIADERERIQETFDAQQRFSEAAQQKMRGYIHELESRLTVLPSEIEAGLDPRQIAKMLGESLRQRFLRCGISDTVKGLQATVAAMTSAQKELSTALHRVSDSRDGVLAQVEQANSLVTYSLQKQAKTVDALLHEWKSDMLRIWIPLIAGAALLIGLLSGMRIQSYCDAASATGPARTSMQAAPDSAPQPDGVPSVNAKQHRTQGKQTADTSHER